MSDPVNDQGQQGEQQQVASDEGTAAIGPATRASVAARKLWRYFSLPKLLHILQSDALFFARLDQLNDPFEGFPTSAEYAEGRRILDSSIVRVVMDVATVALRSTAYVNCWSQFNFENASMWRAYGTDSGGVLIQTCFEKLRRALPDYVSLSRVQYVSDDFNENLADLKARVFRKLQCFSHEAEVRAVILDETATMRDAMDGRTNKGIIVPIELGLQNLVERIVIQPTAPEWIHGVVKDILRKYDISGEVLHPSILQVRKRRPGHRIHSLAKPASLSDRPISHLIDTDETSAVPPK